MTQIILVASGKGGTGKTFFTANMGAILAEEGKKVVLIDMDMELRNLDLQLGLENKVVYNIVDALTGTCRIQQALIRDKRFPNMFLMAAASPNEDREITPLHMKVLCDRLSRVFDYIVIDAPAGMGEGLEIAAAAADIAVLVSETDISAARDAEATENYLSKLGIDKMCYVLNKVHAGLMAEGIIPSIADITRELRMDLVGIIQFDENVFVSTNRGEPIVLNSDAYIYDNIKNIVKRILKSG